MTVNVPVLQSERLCLRPVSRHDAEALFPAYSDAELMRYWSSAPKATVDELRDYLTPGGIPCGRSWGITIKQGYGTAIGTLSVIARRPGVSEIGYLVARAYWGKGVAAEAVSCLVDHLFRAEGHRRLCADTDPDNLHSNHLLERLGFRREGYLREEWETHIGVRDSVIWGLLASEWAERSELAETNGGCLA